MTIVGKEFATSYTFEVSGSNADYDYLPLGTKDLTEFPELVTLAEGEHLRMIAKSRGAWGNNVRALIVDRDIYRGVKYFDTSDEEIDLPSDMTISDEASATVLEMWNEYKNNPAEGEDGHDNSLAWPVVSNMDTPVDDEKHFAIVIEEKRQGSSAWTTEEVWLVSSNETDTDDSNNDMFVESVVNNGSDYIWVKLNENLRSDNETDNGPVSLPMKKFAQLSGGFNGEWGRHDGVTAQEAEDSAVNEAYELYSHVNEIDVNLFIDSDKGVSVKQNLISICEDIRKDSMCILDVPKELVKNNSGNEAYDIVKWRKGQGGSLFHPNTSYAALYGNWLEINDKWNRKHRWVPASGYVAGIYASTDETRDPWFAPAGLNRGVLQGIRRLAWNPKEEHVRFMYQNGINPIVSYAGQGKVVWGQKTLLDKQSAFNRINVRRLFLVLEKAISKSSKWFLFEQNDETTWLLMKNMIEPFLRDVRGRRGIHDFLVQIDETTNTPERMGRNEMWGNIWIKPTRSTEFIVLNFIATKTGASFEEMINSGII